MFLCVRILATEVFPVLSRLKTGNRVAGVKQSSKAICEGMAKCAFIAENADSALTGPILELCSKHDTEVIMVSSTWELGRACGIDVGAAVAVLLRD
ncbi:MAG TPA: 50S ribosomal protein L7ae-like protein [Clostridiales bacterium]|jgi:large subunit ribosomal protein L7A|nr:50S ribosomal protein L7ae-like protein [Clostridiales bacterium]